MNTKRIVAWLLAASLLAPVIGLGQDSDADRSHPAQFVKDSAITAAIKTKLAADHPGIGAYAPPHGGFKANRESECARHDETQFC